MKFNVLGLFLFIVVNVTSLVHSEVISEYKPVIGNSKFTESNSDAPKRDLRYELYFNPLLNSVKIDNQRIDYDLTRETVLKMGPYTLHENDIEMIVTREQGEFFELGFGLEMTRRIGSVYVISFRWPKDYIERGTLEIIDDKGQVYWRKELTEKIVDTWDGYISLQRQGQKQRIKRVLPNPTIKTKRVMSPEEFETENSDRYLGKVLPKAISKRHWDSQIGLSHKGFLDLPISQIKENFRFCVSRDDESGRLALCSKRYRFVRDSGRYFLKSVNRNSQPRVYVNDGPVTLKGSAIFLDTENHIKFSAILKNGSYYEFVARPKEIKLIDMVKNVEENYIEIIGYGDPPMGQVEKSYFANLDHWGFLNFMPTIGDMRRFWRALITDDAPYLYLKGHGGVPFRQPFVFDSLPNKNSRVVLSEKTQKSTYSDRAYVYGKKPENVKVRGEDDNVKEISNSEFEWAYRAPVKGTYNEDSILIDEGDKTWKATYEIFRGYPGEISARASGVISDQLHLVFMGEVGGQYWFEKLLGLENYYISKLRWGIAAKYFQSLGSVDLKGDESVNSFVMNVANVDLKYRFTPGIWGRDPSVGALLSWQQVNYNPPQLEELGVTLAPVPMLGVGAFWARSMPQFFDDFFNLIPIFRYPKWVDMEFIYYAMPMDSNNELILNIALNFHGKIQWNENFFGEAGFGLKSFSFKDFTAQKSVATAVAVGTVGIGVNF